MEYLQLSVYPPLTVQREQLRDHHLTPLFAVAVKATEEAILNPKIIRPLIKEVTLISLGVPGAR